MWNGLPYTVFNTAWNVERVSGSSQLLVAALSGVSSNFSWRAYGVANEISKHFSPIRPVPLVLIIVIKISNKGEIERQNNKK